MKKINGFLLCLIAIVFGLTSCDEWLDVNTSQDSAVVVTADEALPTILFYSSQSTYDHAEYGVYLSQALTTGGRAQVSSYAYKNGWEFLSMNRHPQWRRHYYDIGVNVNSMIEAAEKIGSRNFVLIGRTLMLNSMLLTTDAFGDMPRSNAYKANAPTYDTQESIYAWMEQEVDDLLQLYDNPEWTECKTNKNITSKMDRVYQGDLGKWRAFTKAIKARILIRKLPNWNNTPATCDEIIAAVEAALDDPSWTEPHYLFDGNGSGEKNCQWGPSQPTCNLGWAQGRPNLLTEAIPSHFFGQALLGFYPRYRQTSGYALDPRAVYMMTPRVDANGDKLLRYLDNNIGMSTAMKATYYPDLYCGGDGAGSMPDYTNPYTKDNGYIAFITEEELMFIKAEAQYWKGDKGGAYSTTVEAVKKNMERYGVQSSSSIQQKIYQKFFDVRLPADEFSLSDIMQQKYVAMYLQPEQWTDLRRYNYSSKANGIQYNGEYIYTVRRVHDGSDNASESTNFKSEYSLTRPYNLYEPYWLTSESFGVNAKLSPNAWINRLNYDPETEDKYNRNELERLGAYKNPNWLRKRMIWAYKNNSYVTCADATVWQ